MSTAATHTAPADRILAGVALMLGFCITAPLLDVAAKLASGSVPVGQITAARFIVQCALMAPVVWTMGLSLRVARRQWLTLLLRTSLLLVSTFSFIAAIRVMPLADALAIVFVAPFIVLLVGKFYLGEDVGPRRVGLQSWVLWGNKVTVPGTEQIHLTASFGVAVYQVGEGRASLFARADTALYKAKAAGRNRVSLTD